LAARSTARCSGLNMLATWGVSTFPKPTLALDFAGATSLDSRITFTRGSTATFFNSSGVLQTASNDVARFDHDPATLAPLGLLIEEQRTNSIRNNTMVGAVAGTPGTLPTNWGIDTPGLTTSVIGTGTSAGITYVDIKLSGTTSNSYGNIFFETSTAIAATNAQTWAHSLWIAVVGGATTNITTIRHAFDQFSNVPAYLATIAGSNIVSSVTGTLQRSSAALTTNNASTASVRPSLSLLWSNGVAIDITLRIGLPQLELGAFATSVIPTTTTALTRNADVASMTGTNFSSWFNAAQGTVLCSATRQSSGQPYLWMFSNGATASERYYLRYVTTEYQFIPRASGVDGAGAYVSAASALLTARHATAYVSNQNRISSNGFQDGNSTKTVTSQPTSLDTLYLGSFTGTGSFLNGTIQRLAFYPVALPDSTLQALTA